MSEQGAEGTQTQATGEQSAAVDFSPVLDRITELGERFDSFEQGQQGPQQPAYDPFAYDPYGPQQQEPGFQQGQPQQPGYDQGFQQPQYDQFGQPLQDPYQTQQPQQGAEMLQQLIQQAVGQAVAPIHQQLGAERQERMQEVWEGQITELETEFPDLAGDQGEQVAEQAFNLAGEIAQQMLPQLPPQLQQALGQSGVDLGKLIAAQPGFIRNTYLAGKASTSAEQEKPAGTSQEFQLEAGGGAAQPGNEGASEGSQYLGLSNPARERSLSELW